MSILLAVLLGPFSLGVLKHGGEAALWAVIFVAVLGVISAVTLVPLTVQYLAKITEITRHKEFRRTVRALFFAQPQYLQEAIDSVLRERSEWFHSACAKQAECLRRYAQALAGADGDKERLIETWDKEKEGLDQLVAGAKWSFWDHHGSLERMVKFLALPTEIKFRKSSKEYLSDGKSATAVS